MLGPAIGDLGRDGHISGAWMGDPKSAEVVALYNQRVMRAPGGPYHALLLYQNELMRVRDQLKVMEQEYRRAEQDNADLFPRELL